MLLNYGHRHQWDWLTHLQGLFDGQVGWDLALFSTIGFVGFFYSLPILTGILVISFVKAFILKQPIKSLILKIALLAQLIALNVWFFF